MMRRGVALVLVLGFALVATTAATGMLLSRRSVWRAGLIQEQEAAARDLALVTEGDLLQWLERHGSTVVLPPEGGGMAWCHDQIMIGDRRLAIQVDLYDRCGMDGPDPALASEDPGLAYPKRHRLGMAVFPPRLPTPPRRWGSIEDLMPDEPTGGVAWASRVDPWPGGGWNVNTAPVDRLVEAYRGLGIPGIETVIVQRRQGVPSQAPVQPPEGDHRILIAGSRRWAARITARCQGRTVAWWSVIEGTPVYRIVQRYPING